MDTSAYSRYTYRGKRSDNGEWVHGVPLYDNADCELKKQGKCKCGHDGSVLLTFFAWIEDLHEYDECEINPKTIGQCTGMKDKNGAFIFEGDIISDGRNDWMSDHRGGSLIDKYVLHKTRITGEPYKTTYGKLAIPVRWEDESCGFEPFSDSWENCRHCGGGLSPGEVEVIGNIHDNPGLLETQYDN